MRLSLPWAVSRSFFFPIRILTVRGLDSDEDMPRTTSSIRAGRSATAMQPKNRAKSPVSWRLTNQYKCCIVARRDSCACDYSLPHPIPLLQTMSIGQPMLMSTKSSEMWSSISSATFVIMSSCTCDSSPCVRPRSARQRSVHCLSRTNGAGATPIPTTARQADSLPWPSHHM